MVFATTSTRIPFLVVMAALFAVGAQGQPTLDRSFVNSQRTVLERYFEETGLTNKLEILRIRQAPHPDLQEWGRRVYRLEVRYRTTETDETLLTEEFLNYLDQHQVGGGFSLPDKIFYKLVHLLGLDRRSVSVHFHILDNDFAVFLDSERRLVLQRGANRNLRETLELRMPLKSSDRHLAVSVDSAQPASTTFTETIRDFLEKRFATANQGTSLPPPALDFQPLEADYVGLAVRGLKRHVLKDKNYWEKIQLSLDLKPSAEGIRLVFHLDGQYASGLGHAQPDEESYSDLEPRYRAQLETFAGNLLDELQRQLERNRP